MLTSWIQAVWEVTETERDFYMRYNKCGNCYHGPCMCSDIGNLKNRIIPPPNDDHIWTKTPGEVISSTYAFIKEMHENVEEGKKRRISQGNALPTDILQPWTNEDDTYWLVRD